MVVLLCRDGVASKWPPVLKVWEQLCELSKQNVMKLLQTKNFGYTIVSIPLPDTKAEKNKHETFDFVLLLSSSTRIIQNLKRVSQRSVPQTNPVRLGGAFP